MAIPSQIKTAVIDLLRIPADTLTFDPRIESAYQRALVELTRETDLFAQEQQIAAVTDQSIYTAADGTTRILAVLHHRTQMMLTPSRSLDLLSKWQTDSSGEPEEWVQDKVPPSLDDLSTISPLQFALHPAPSVNGDAFDGIVLYRIAPPLNDTPPPWMSPYLIYKTAAIFSNESTEERDAAASQLWEGIAEVWRDLLVM